MSVQTLLRAANQDAGTPVHRAEHHPEGPPASDQGVPVDEILGAAEGRFFGSGYRRITQRILDLAWDPAASTPDGGPLAGRRAGGRAAISCPTDWSCKNGSAVAPHLSSVDALALSLRLVDAFLGNGYDGTDRRASGVWLRRFVMKSGGEPHLDLGNVGLDVVERERVPSQVRPGGWSSTFDCVVGNIKVRCEVEQEADLAVRRLDAGGRLAVPAAPDHSAYQDRIHHITDVTVDVPSHSASGVARTVDAEPVTAAAGDVGGGSSSLLDSMIVLAQLGQALLYRLDSLDRAQTNTLWMRRVDMWRNDPYQPLGVPMRCTTEVTRSSTVDLAGTRWRVSNMAGTCGGTTVRYSVGHQLPASGGGAA